VKTGARWLYSSSVRIAITDMNEHFHRAVYMCLPLAKVVVDKFNLIRHVNGALDKVRSKLQGKIEEVREGNYSEAGIPCLR
jgi:transposase